jgi:hypothetical protein
MAGLTLCGVLAIVGLLATAASEPMRMSADVR